MLTLIDKSLHKTSWEHMFFILWKDTVLMLQSVSRSPVFFAQGQKPWLRVDKESHVALSVKQKQTKNHIKPHIHYSSLLTELLMDV